jgi:hypothetical protein
MIFSVDAVVIHDEDVVLQHVHLVGTRKEGLLGRISSPEGSVLTAGPDDLERVVIDHPERFQRQGMVENRPVRPPVVEVLLVVLDRIAVTPVETAVEDVHPLRVVVLDRIHVVP